MYTNHTLIYRLSWEEEMVGTNSWSNTWFGYIPALLFDTGVAAWYVLSGLQSVRPFENRKMTGDNANERRQEIRKKNGTCRKTSRTSRHTYCSRSNLLFFVYVRGFIYRHGTQERSPRFRPSPPILAIRGGWH